MAKRGRPVTVPKRLLLSLPPDLYELVSVVAKRLGQSKAGLVRELLEQYRPWLKTMREALDKIAGGRKEEAKSLVSALATKVSIELQEELKTLDRTRTRPKR
jgi:predicted DNA-binding protein